MVGKVFPWQKLSARVKSHQIVVNDRFSDRFSPRSDVVYRRIRSRFVFTVVDAVTASDCIFKSHIVSFYQRDSNSDCRLFRLLYDNRKFSEKNFERPFARIRDATKLLLARENSYSTKGMFIYANSCANYHREKGIGNEKSEEEERKEGKLMGRR